MHGLLTCKIHAPYPNSSKNLNPFQNQFQVASKSTMGDIWSIVEAKFFYSCEPVKPEQLCASKIKWWDRQRADSVLCMKYKKVFFCCLTDVFNFKKKSQCKEKNLKEKRRQVPGKSKTQQVKFHGILRLKNNFLGLTALPLRAHRGGGFVFCSLHRWLGTLDHGRQSCPRGYGQWQPGQMKLHRWPHTMKLRRG